MGVLILTRRGALVRKAGRDPKSGEGGRGLCQGTLTFDRKGRTAQKCRKRGRTCKKETSRDYLSLGRRLSQKGEEGTMKIAVMKELNRERTLAEQIPLFAHLKKKGGPASKGIVKKKSYT